ncbi:hypothetical protein DB30_07145 [Enhygromyxa salina]|uniref:MORN repeat variant n=1 Tax=Enhygromyxa salina TaxID=215803 RepID=A0A0C1ZMY4_9BACT|nr:hypothetical protein [Enhygromyxa salina]KIG18809.1 hypothetical protein DB30_07145 [Enhygromyxa salina]
MLKKNDFDDLDVSDDGVGDVLLEGRLYSGIAFERYESGGLLALAGFDQGRKYGVWRKWYPSGKLESERFFNCGNNGPWREWDERGLLRVDDYWECGVLVRRRRYGEGGALVETYDLSPDSTEHKRLLRARTRMTWKVVDIDVETWQFVEHPPGWGLDETAG